VHRRHDHPLRVEHHDLVARARRQALVLACTLSAALLLTTSAYASPDSYFSNLGVASMTTERTAAVAAPLPNGQVLFAGGLNFGGILSSVELFNPQTDTFTSAPNAMTTTRYGSVAAPLPNGEVLIAGGSSSFANYLASAELFNPASGTFTSLPAGMTAARYGAVAAPLPNGEVLIAGGYNIEELSSAELFNPQTDTFTGVAGTMTISRQEAIAAPLPDGDVLIAGGQHNGVLSSAELFDPATDTFTSVSGTMTTARYAAMSAPLPDGSVLIAGGQGNGELSNAELFDPAGDTFTSVPGTMTEAREGSVAATLPDGAVLVAGGYNSGILSSAELFYTAPEVSSSGGAFGDETVGEPSSLQTIRVSNIGAQALTITAVKLEGADAADFAISTDGCEGRRLPFEGSCTVSVRFTPSQQGASVASLALADNETTPSVIGLSGTGVPANSGPTGPTGPQGASGAAGPQGTAGVAGTTGLQGPTGVAGPTGPRGATGPKGAVQIVTCYTVTISLHQSGHKTHANHRACSVVSAPATSTLAGRAGAARAKLERGHRVYAEGTGILNARGGLKLLLSDSRTLKPGTYTLILVRRRGARWVTTRVQVTIG
jgi:Collagen triple helix repeat (20 copies)/Kelch motif